MYDTHVFTFINEGNVIHWVISQEETIAEEYFKEEFPDVDMEDVEHESYETGFAFTLSGPGIVMPTAG